MTVTSRLPVLIDYLVNLFTTDPTIGAATPPVTVYDGPPTTALDPGLKLFVGLTDPDSTSPEPAGDTAQTWAGMGKLGRNEQVTIHCCAEAWSGLPGGSLSDDIQVQRLAVYGIVSAVETLMQNTTIPNILFPDPGLATTALIQSNASTGTLARVTFDLIFKSRIGG